MCKQVDTTVGKFYEASNGVLVPLTESGQVDTARLGGEEYEMYYEKCMLSDLFDAVVEYTFNNSAPIG